jgi:hypothetical protein
MSNQQYEETLEEQSNKELASILGISYDELCQLEWDVESSLYINPLYFFQYL